MRLLLAGDVHGDGNHLLYLFKMAEQFDADRIFALGDFGFWEHRPDGIEFLQEAELMVDKFGFPLYWLDGNHENHSMLRKVYADKVVDEGMWEIRPGVLYSPRGNRFTWDGVKFMTVGGAYSIDKNYRRPGTSWWPQETLDNDDVLRAIDDGSKVDIILSHDLPAGIDMAAIMRWRGFDYHTIPDSEQNRRRLRSICDAVLPDFLWHGHYHMNYFQELPIAFGNHLLKVRGLACNDMGQDSWTIIDTKDYQ